MSRQDKATTDRNAKLLRELVKHPDNKQCADCRRNDARWASWNLGCFMCIRCSGIHRSMGTHVSKVKSIDLDIWTPEQMENIQRWGNKLANLYWEAHLKPGHVPPEHKIESFIRSKYESRRWAMSGPVPSDPRVMLRSEESADDDDNVPLALSAASSAPPPPPPANPPQTQFRAPPPPSQRSHIAHPLLSRQAPMPAPASTKPPRAPTPPPAAAPTQQPHPAPSVSSSLFDLDFHAPAPSASGFGGSGRPSEAKKTGIDDIMSLFSAPPPPAPAPPPAHGADGGWGGFSSAPAAATAPAYRQQQQGGMGGLSNGFGGLNLGGGSDVWGQPTAVAAQASRPQQAQPQNGGASWGGFQSSGSGASNLWDAAPSSASASQDIWGSASAKPASTAPAKADDLFADIWK